MILKIQTLAETCGNTSDAPYAGDFLASSPGTPVQAFSLRPDMGICFWQSPARQQARNYRLQFAAPCFWFSFVLNGTSTTCCRRNSSQSRMHGTLEIRCVQKHDTIDLRQDAGIDHKWVDIILCPDFLNLAAPGESMHLPEYIKNMMKNDGEYRAHLIQRMSPDQHIAATQLAACPYTFAARTLYLKSKTLELLSHTIADHAQVPCRTRLSSYEIECLNQAKDFLVKDLNNPPSLKDLATHVGMCETKLRSRFKAMFGQTIFEYFRNYRIDLARQLLVQNNMSVSKVAYEIGYTNLSHFSAAFKERHGVNPSQLNKHPEQNTI